MTNPLNIIQPNYFKKIAKVLVLVIIVSFSIFSASSRAIAGEDKNDIYDLTNNYRIKKGLKPLLINSALENAANYRAQDMINNQYFEHVSPIGATPWEAFNKYDYDYRFAGENLAMGFENIEYAFNAWINSLTHYKNIVNKNYDEIGVAIIQGNIYGKDTTLIVQVFGKQKSGLVKGVNDLPENIVSSTKTVSQKISSFLSRIFKFK
ncbi:MAG: hypothetical protein CEN91_44 [Candidatus Berkelbacteria bacterium Licking1014_85]|uniref:SCP domain-containing protein n=1 Tax=Candidatus Berkelbacteria bacterium Licking1014_85 TaxID=2017148 RepID=A0A554LM78_9BACT|nr:MAG: hypothetical protein CEN91_44 [Candidatus Berkelbacteria bacterium Licking1014_85]